MGRLQGKRIIITGAAGGIGSAAATLFCREGARVALADIDSDRGEQATAEARAAGGEAVFVETDIVRPESVEALVRQTVEAFGGLDVLYNNAGGATARDGGILDIPLEEFWRTIGVDLYGTFLACRFAVPHLQASGEGAIINTTSIRAMKATRGADAYTSAKGGVLTLTKALALECAPLNIRVNAIAPGPVLTERTRSFGMTVTQDLDPDHPIRTGQPEEVAALALFLASSESSLINGAIIPADSGGSIF